MEAVPVGAAPRRDYAQDVRYFAIEHMDKVRPLGGREGGLGHVRREASQVSTKPH